MNVFRKVEGGSNWLNTPNSQRLKGPPRALTGGLIFTKSTGLVRKKVK